MCGDGKINLKSQNALVWGKQIFDSVLIANECLEGKIRSSDSGVLVKSFFYIGKN